MGELWVYYLDENGEIIYDHLEYTERTRNELERDMYMCMDRCMQDAEKQGADSIQFEIRGYSGGVLVYVENCGNYPL